VDGQRVGDSYDAERWTSESRGSSTRLLPQTSSSRSMGRGVLITTNKNGQLFDDAENQSTGANGYFKILNTI